ncbi:MAG: EamA family transporter [Methanofollis sp.]|uniref:EamA family transporter n=1 Tax=Methanofollis sp. TaxID=2052835 RepID=UPI00262EB566|nr:EamA family transporter [Methanofollis sp.]MDD4254880.1 EamA family transporter [Methanofollis sp.]
MIWIALALLGALAHALYSIAVKRYLQDYRPAHLAGRAFLTGGLILLALACARGLPETGPLFLPALAASSALNAAAVWLTYRALAETDISLAVPMLSLTPIFLVGPSYLLLGEAPGAGGAAGIVLIVAGSYVLGTGGGEGGVGVLAPIRALWMRRGTAMMAGVAIIYSLTATLDKVLILQSDPFFGLGLDLLAIGALFWVLILASGGTPAGPPPAGRAVAITGGLLAFEILSVGLALSLQIVPYVISVKRTSILFAVVIGGFIFKEASPGRRSTATAVMVVGTVCILLFS